MPTLIDGHYDQLATNWSLAYQQNADGFVADRGASVVNVALQSGLYLRYKREAFFRSDAGPRALGGQPQRTSLGTDTASYFAQERAVRYLLDDRQRANATPPFDPERSAVELLTSQMMVDRDTQFCSKVMGTGIWTTDITGVASSPSTNQTLQWDATGATPGEDVRKYKNTVKKLTGMMPNTLTLGADTAVEVFNTADYLDRVKYTKGGVFNASDMATYFDVDTVLVASAVKNTADEGQTMTGGFIAGSKDALLSYVDPNPGLEKPTSVVAFVWTGLLGGGAWTPTAVMRGRLDDRYSDYFDVRTAYDIEVVAPDLGVYFHSIVS